MSDIPPISSDNISIDLNSDEYFMGEAIKEALKAYKMEEVPVGAVIVSDGQIIGRGYNQVETLKDATAHAEMLALTAAQESVGDWRLSECDLFVTKEPCPMCAGGIVHCRIRVLVYGCSSPKDGAAGGGFINLLEQPTLNHTTEIRSGVLADQSAQILRDFFQGARIKSKELDDQEN
ncbi:MAG: tRNA adenosine(34) deaminase TadA [Verrucomicrobiota bacterium]|nr:tRNA adenosine(34) deaminase TadA [Verrucomicrobiota bacterium]MEC9327154.1 tRNA adenosine(34) deaminase TadA [Verrucomicrobiota bacterium]MED6299751.1 tRNA adenosine(34) deaminase TadA [Verrucomicrobiota bacterium]MEE3177897.1 tRNA adenosine(34) deaminase TadA [Verrucomicrobiota bacterium]